MEVLGKTLRFFLKSDCSLSKAELDFIRAINEILKNFSQIKERLYTKENDLFDIEFTRDLFNYYDENPMFVQLEFTHQFDEPQSVETFNDIIRVERAPDLITMSEDDFKKFIFRKNIDTIFLAETYPRNMFLNENIDSIFDNEETALVKNILIKYIKKYNGILEKVDSSLLITKIYFCLFNNFAFGWIKECEIEDVDEKFILSLISIMAEEEIKKKLNFLREKQRQEKLQRDVKLQIDLKELEEKILKDKIFVTCSSEADRLRYLRGLLKNSTEDLLDCLEMERTSTGLIRAKGIQGKLFINRLWGEIKNSGD